jgi:hypothetical protein
VASSLRPNFSENFVTDKVAALWILVVFVVHGREARSRATFHKLRFSVVCAVFEDAAELVFIVFFASREASFKTVYSLDEAIEAVWSIGDFRTALLALVYTITVVFTFLADDVSEALVVARWMLIFVFRVSMVVDDDLILLALSASWGILVALSASWGILLALSASRGILLALSASGGILLALSASGGILLALSTSGGIFLSVVVGLRISTSSYWAHQNYWHHNGCENESLDSHFDLLL